MKMKNLVAKLVIALVVLVGVPSIGLAKTNMNSFTETVLESSNGNFDSYRVAPYASRVHKAFFEVGKYNIVLRGDGDTDLDLYVYDSDGDLIGSFTDRDDYESITLTVRKDGYFYIKIINRGSVYNDYELYYR